MTGLDVPQLRAYVIRPTLRYLAESNLMAWTLAAENLVLGTVLTESRAKYLRQLGGPARGIGQMEPFTHDDIWRNWLAHPVRKPLADRLRAITPPAGLAAGADGMEGCLYYAVGMCRVFYRRLPDALPAAHDALGMARLWKRRYNTALGAGTVDKALPWFAQACGVQS